MSYPNVLNYIEIYMRKRILFFT